MSTLDVTGTIETIMGDVVARLDEFSHIDPSRIIVSISFTRSGGVGGTCARIHPLRFQGGDVTTVVTRGRHRYRLTMPTLTHRGREALYLITFLVPRFLNLPPREKLATIVHELYHVSPAFDGDIRRFPGRNFAHGPSRKRYNRLIETFVDHYLALDGSAEILAPLAPPLIQLKALHRAVVGRRFPAPRVRVERI